MKTHLHSRREAARGGSRASPAGLVLLVALAALVPACDSDAAAPTTPPPDRDRAPGFEEVAEAAGLDFHMTFLETEQGENFKINLYDHGAGVSVGDVDGDGLDDIYLLNQLGPNGLFHNRGDGTFEDVTERAGVGLADRICTSASFADYDNDGDQDLFVGSTRGGNVLLRNDGTGVFTDVSKAAGVDLVGHTQGVAFFDYDVDGDLDLFLTNTAAWTLDLRDPEGRYHVGPENLMELLKAQPEPCVLYRNEGDGTFRDVTAQAGVAGDGWGGDIGVFDADEDGDPDLLVTSMFGPSHLYRNDGDGSFTDVADEALGRTPWGGVGCKILDYDGDGRLDVFIVDMHSDMWMNQTVSRATVRETDKYAGPEGPMFELGLMDGDTRDHLRQMLRVPDVDQYLFGNALYRNLGGLRFEEVSAAAGVETMWPWGIATGDFDLDGAEDIFIPAGMGFPFFRWHNSLLMSGGDGTFEQREREEGIEPRPGGHYLDEQIAGVDAARSSRSAAVLDYDGDGRPDLVVNNFNERPYLYRNRFPQRSWVGLRLRGTRSNRDAIGATVRVTAGDRTLVRMVQAAGGYLAQSTLTLHFGLGEAKSIDRCEITWPDGSKQDLPGLALSQVHEIVEPADRPR